MSPTYQAQYDYNTVGSKCNPYPRNSKEWAEYEIAFQRHWAELQGVDYGFKEAS